MRTLSSKIVTFGDHISMTVTECWKAYKYALPEQHAKKHIKLVEFADSMAFDLAYNKYSSECGGGSLLEQVPLTIE